MKNETDSTELSPGSYFAVVKTMKPCRECSGPSVVTFKVNDSGYAIGSGYLHDITCPIAIEATK